MKTAWFALLITFNLHGEPTAIEKLAVELNKEDCQVFAQIRAGQRSGPRSTVVGVCVELAAPTK